MTTNYDTAVLFTKHTNLLPYFDAHYANSLSLSLAHTSQLRHRYSKDRDVQLILLVRYDYDERSNCRTYCKIRCPINPLPICGEFEVVSLAQIIKHIEGYGWSLKQKMPISLLR